MLFSESSLEGSIKGTKRAEVLYCTVSEVSSSTLSTHHTSSRLGKRAGVSNGQNSVEIEEPSSTYLTYL